MKRAISILLAAVMLLCFCACGGSGEPETDKAAFAVSESDIVGKRFSTKDFLSYTSQDGITYPMCSITFEPDGLARYSKETYTDGCCTWFIRDNIIYTTIDIYSSTSFVYWNGYLIPMNDNCEGTIPNRDLFEATVSRTRRQIDDDETVTCEFAYRFNANGQVIYQYSEGEEIIGSTDMTYERDGDIITILRENKDGKTVLDRYILSVDGTPYLSFLMPDDE